MKKFLKVFLSILCILLIVFSTIYIIYFFEIKKVAKEERNLLNTIIVDLENNTGEKNTSGRILQVKKLKEEYSNIVGWLEIENTNINYPVLQGVDNDYYLEYDYKNEKTAKGSIFLDSEYNWNLPSTNMIIYGHNMKNGEMFENLLNYSSKEFYLNHKIIKFTSENVEEEYEIFSVLKSRVYYKSENNVFRFYQFINANNIEEFNSFVYNAKNESLYDTKITPNYGDKLITLITCSYHIPDGRFAVIGRKIRDIT